MPEVFKSIFIFVISFFSSVSFSTESPLDYFDKLQGCYQTLEYNHRTVAPPPEKYSPGHIEKGESWFALGPQGEILPAYNILFYQGKINGVYNNGYTSPFIALGEYSLENNLISYHFKGKLRYRFQPDLIGNVLLQIKVHQNLDGTILFENYLKILETDEYNINEVYLLKKVPCAN